MLRKRLEDYISQWSLTLEGHPLQTPTGLVAKVRWDNQPCILKIAPDEGDEKTAVVLNHYDGNGAVWLYKSEGRVSLLERAIPGTPLSEMVKRGEDGQATHILCDVIQKLHSHKIFSGTYSSIEELSKGFTHYLESGDSQISGELVKEAESVYGELLKSQKQRVLLHGDLHHDNVLYDETRGWLAIDPKGYVGEAAFEVGALLRNPLGYSELIQSPEFIQRRVEIICERLGLDRKRVIGWAFSQAVLAGIWSVEDGKSPEWAMQIALAFKRWFKADLDFFLKMN